MAGVLALRNNAPLPFLRNLPPLKSRLERPLEPRNLPHQCLGKYPQSALAGMLISGPLCSKGQLASPLVNSKSYTSKQILTNDATKGLRT